MRREAPHFVDEAFLLHFGNQLARQLMVQNYINLGSLSTNLGSVWAGNAVSTVFFYIFFRNNAKIWQRQTEIAMSYPGNQGAREACPRLAGLLL